MKTVDRAASSLVLMVLAAAVVTGLFWFLTQATSPSAQLADSGAATDGVSRVPPAVPGSSLQPAQTASVPVVPAARDAAVISPAPAGPAAPSFDVVRIGPSGQAVLAGRAEPGARVTIRDGAAVIGQSTADSRGEWVVVPTAAIESGGRSLALVARGATGVDVAAAETLMVIVPPRPVATAPAAPASEPVLALLLPAVGPARMVQASGAAALAMQLVDYDDRGAIRFAGSAPPGAKLRLYIDNAPAGEAVASSSGQWALTPAIPVSTGVHTLRLDQLGNSGVTARVELPFQRDPAPARMAATDMTSVTRVVVQPGQTLWRLARTAYGEGTRYTVIYSANQGQIRDPNLIYPGQAFALPTQ